MQRRGLTLTGDWTGVFDYADAGETADAVPFVASLFDVAGAIWGTTQEPNTFVPGAAAEIAAEVNGTRSGREVRLRKVYVGAPTGADLPIDYAGHVSADGNRIEGRWQIVDLGRRISGAFVMNRKPGEKAVITRSVEAEVSIRF